MSEGGDWIQKAQDWVQQYAFFAKMDLGGGGFNGGRDFCISFFPVETLHPTL